MTCNYGDKHYVGEVGTELLIAVGPLETFSEATLPEIKVKKPDDTMATWVGTLVTDYDSECAYIQYTTEADDFSVAGEYEFQASAAVAGWTGRGETVKLVVWDTFS